MFTIACDELIREIIDEGEIVPMVAIVFGCLTGMIAITFGSIASIAKTRAAEQTRREIAAYVAEGSISSEDAVAMLKAGGGEVEA